MERLTGTRIDHVAMIDFQGFVALTQDLEGVTVQNKTAFSSHGHTYPAGNITLSGEAALWYVREKDLPGGEEDRAENQRNVLKAILAKGCPLRSSPIRSGSPTSWVMRRSGSRWTRA